MDVSVLTAASHPVLRGVLLLLLLMSVASWVIALERAWQVWRVRRANQQFLQRFWDDDAPLARPVPEQVPASPFGALYGKAEQTWRQRQQASTPSSHSLDEWLVRALRQEINRHSHQGEAGLTCLATIGSIAPFVGLFGTVWGIYLALQGMGHANAGGIAAIAGPMGEALLTTAAGLVAAIPAVVAYNSLVRAHRSLRASMEDFAHDVHAYWLQQKSPASQGSL